MNDQIETSRNAALRFQTAFVNAIAAVEADNYFLLHTSAASHDAAIDEFRRSLSGEEQTRFDVVVTDYREYRSHITPAITQYMREQATGQAFDSENDLALKRSLHAMMEFANPR